MVETHLLAFVVPLSPFENREFVFKGVRSMSRTIARKIYVITESYDVWRELESIDKVVVIEQGRPGCGRARDIGILSAVEDGFRFVVVSDGHVIFEDMYGVLKCVETMVSNEVVAMCVPRIFVVTESGEKTGAYSDGGYFTYSKLMYRHYIHGFSMYPRRIIGSNEPVYVLDLYKARIVYNKRGFYHIPYWGMEIFDLSMSLRRLGYEIVSSCCGLCYHLYRSRFPSGRLEDESLWYREPWYRKCVEMGVKPYVCANYINVAMYVFGHYVKHLDDVMKYAGRNVSYQAMVLPTGISLLTPDLKEMIEKTVKLSRNEAYDVYQGFPEAMDE